VVGVGENKEEGKNGVDDAPVSPITWREKKITPLACLSSYNTGQ